MSDVNEDDWSTPYIQKVYNLGIIQGDENGEFKPNDEITRADTVVILSRLLGVENIEYTDNFDDVVADSYYAKYVGVLKHLGLVNGYNNNFNPTGSITREDAMVIINNIISTLNIDTNNDITTLSKFKDAQDISNYANKSVAVLVNLGIINGSDNNINPKENITREQLCKIVSDLHELIIKQ